MTESPGTEEQTQSPSPPSDRPGENTEPPSNPEIDPERVEREREDAERTLAS